MFTAGVYDIHLALEILKAKGNGCECVIIPTCNNQCREYAIFSDSYGPLMRITKAEYKDPLIRLVQHTVESLREKGMYIEMCWIPGHAGITGNKEVDVATKKAAKGAVRLTPRITLARRRGE